MGWETLVQVGSAVYDARTANRAARTEARAITDEAAIVAGNKARDTVREAGRLQSSFLSSGLTMEGTPTEVLKRSYQFGLDDINQIAKNANTRSKNIMTKARSQMLEGFTTMAKGVDFGGTGTLIDDISFGTGSINGFGQELGSLFAGESMGPFQSPWG